MDERNDFGIYLNVLDVKCDKICVVWHSPEIIWGVYNLKTAMSGMLGIYNI